MRVCVRVCVCVVLALWECVKVGEGAEINSVDGGVMINFVNNSRTP